MTIPTCWYPGGVVADGDSPCNPTAQQSNCCGPSDICLANNLCFVANLNALHRGSCTDATWGSSACATNICGTIKGWADIKECPYDPANFYCGLDVSSCNNSATAFPLQRGYFADFRNISTPINSPSTAATVTVSMAGGSTIVPATLTVTATAPALSANAASNTNASPSAPVCASNTMPLVAVGAGIGVPLGLALVCALACLFAMRRRQSRPPQVMFGYPGGAPAQGSPKELYTNHAREMGHGRPHEMLAG